MTLASQEAKLEGSRFWLRLMGYTSVAWLARFAIVAAILFAFQCQGDMLIAWCRQWVMWMISILSPTPGGSGVAELMFRLYYADYLPDASVAILAAMLWRAIFYYPFLVMGTIVLPRWIGKDCRSSTSDVFRPTLFHRAPNAARLDTERNLIGHRTQPDRTPNATRLDGERDTTA